MDDDFREVTTEQAILIDGLVDFSSGRSHISKGGGACHSWRRRDSAIAIGRIPRLNYLLTSETRIQSFHVMLTIGGFWLRMRNRVTEYITSQDDFAPGITPTLGEGAAQIGALRGILAPSKAPGQEQRQAPGALSYPGIADDRTECCRTDIAS